MEDREANRDSDGQHIPRLLRNQVSQVPATCSDQCIPLSPIIYLYGRFEYYFSAYAYVFRVFFLCFLAKIHFCSSLYASVNYKVTLKHIK